MKKITITQQEKDQIVKMSELQDKFRTLQYEMGIINNQFWLDFNKRMGGGNYWMDLVNVEMYEYTKEEMAMKNQNQQNK